jgi:hypothetical protein
MPIDPPPEPPLIIEQPGKPSSPIVDMRDAFARKTPQTEEDRARARAFIDGKNRDDPPRPLYDGSRESCCDRRTPSPALADAPQRDAFALPSQS